MAAERKLTEDFLTCPICTDVFHDPCTLQCEHTFCRSCLRSKIEAQPQVAKAGSLFCPFCWRSTPVSGTDTSENEWINSLKPSRKIGGLMDSFVIKSQEREECVVCREEGTTRSSTVWCMECDSAFCDSCLKLHQRMPALRSHKVTENLAEVKSRKQELKCQEHNKKIKMYCKDCNQPLCTLCCSLNHRMCKDVVQTHAIMPEITQTVEDNREMYKTRIQAMNTHITSTKQAIEDKIDNCNKTKRNIDTAIVKMVKMLLDKKKELIAGLDKELQKQRFDLKSKIKLGEMDIQIYQQKAEFITQALQHQATLFHIYLEQSVDDWERQLPSHSQFQFKHNLQDIEDLISEMSIDTDQCDEIVVEIPTKEPTTIDCRVDGDTFNPLLRDVVGVNLNGIDVVVATDWNNAAIRSFYTENNTSWHSTLVCKTGPWSLALLGHHQAAAAATIPGGKQIIVFDIKPELVLKSTIATAKSYTGLDILNPTTFVASSPISTPPSVDVLDITGTLLKTFTEFSSVQGTIKAPYFVHVTSKGNILISDFGQKSLTCITPEGEVVFNYKPTGERRLTDPRGITTTTCGDILLADFGTNTIVNLSESGDFLRNIPIPDELQGVFGLCVKETDIYVASTINGVMAFTYGVH